MPIELQWMDQAKTLVCARLEGRLEAEDFRQSDAKMCEMLDSVDHSVDAIADYSHQFYFAPSYVETTKALVSTTRPNLRFVVFVGSRMAWDLFEAYVALYGEFRFKSAYAETLETAYEVLRQARLDEAHRPPSPESN
jgi:hypothetical protein